MKAIKRQQQKLCITFHPKRKQATATPLYQQTSEDITGDIKNELNQVTADQLYVKLYPNDNKYDSMFPGGVYYRTLEDEDEEVKAKRSEIRKRVAEIVKDACCI